MILDEKNILSLRKDVEKVYGKSVVSYPDCVALSSQMEKRGISMSPQTLRRFYGLIRYNGGFGKFTLDALAAFCGFLDYASFKKAVTENELESFFDDLGGKHSDNDYWAASESLCKRIAEDSALLSNIHYELLKYPMARIFFIEHHPMRDLAATVYAQYFQEYLKYQHNNEARIFAFGFLFMGAFLSENDEFIDLYFKKVQETELISEVYVLPAGRKFGVPLLYFWLKNDEVNFQLTYNQMLEVRKTYCEASEKSVCSFEYSVLEHLIFTDKTAEMKFLIENNTMQKFDDRSFVTKDRKENHDEVWKILCAVAYYKMRDHDKCEYYLSQIDLAKLAVGWKKYYSILYYFMKYEFSDIEEKSIIKTKLTKLIAETHFSYYRTFLENLR